MQELRRFLIYMEYNLTLITSNKDKIRQAKEVFSNTSIQINYIANDLPEIQANSSIEIAKETAIYYAKKINGAVIREDHSLFINALYPFPGPYTNYFDKNMPVETLLSILKKEKDSIYMEEIQKFQEKTTHNLEKPR